MPFNKYGLTAAALAMGTAVPAHANQWLVYTGGERPNRTFTVIDEDYINPEFNSDTSFKVEAATIYEAPTQPDWMTANYHVDCTRKTLRVDLIQISPRDGALRRGTDVGDHAPANVTELQILTFACDKGTKSQAQRAKERDANNDPRNFIYMGPMSLPKVVDAAWEKLWTDGKRPGYSSNVSIADQNAQVEKIMKEKQALVSQAGQIAEQSQRDADTIAASQTRRKDRLKREKEVAPALEEWIGKSEAEVVSAFGPPASSSDRGALRALVYRRTHSETYDAQVGQVGKTGYFEKRENQFHCDLTLGFRNGVLEDYFTEGDRCQILWGPK
ncbi:hypothetical protein ASE06_19760 [Sphingopyxis sp. Root214]|uniref:hypothetical protein n=1 Tax=unclassified Sphingopyxis TaxID=2614943 RepID=UPI0006FE8BF9|nr:MULTISPECIES: hypothetical protein [unclassified Sphingopyxis]KQZ71639.1 hypothetical protein ASD73_17425 [Sphingopyxis sp. Root154]KRC05548.1 hypothetical protein ASE06_19760 [Sphingopyxis sp. Root214]